MIDREFFLGFVRIHILYHASKEPIFGVGIIRELSRHGYCLSAGTLYPTLHRLAEEGYLKQDSKLVGGKVRKYYTITDSGLEVLTRARIKISELVDEVLDDRNTNPIDL